MRFSINRVLTLAACLFMAAAMTFAAPPAHGSPLAAPRAAKIKKHQATGEILAISPTTLVLLHARGRIHQRMTFHLIPQTKETVIATRGRRVTVIYVLNSGRMDALLIRPPKTGK